MNKHFKIFLTNVKCPYCNSNLELIEDKKFVWVGCGKCRIYVRVSKCFISKKVVGKKIFPWREIIQELIDMLYQVCQQ